jgi:hypothetical protein
LARLIARGALVESQDNDTSADTRVEVINGER